MSVGLEVLPPSGKALITLGLLLEYCACIQVQSKMWILWLPFGTQGQKHTAQLGTP